MLLMYISSFMTIISSDIVNNGTFIILYTYNIQIFTYYHLKSFIYFVFHFSRLCLHI